MPHRTTHCPFCEGTSPNQLDKKGSLCSIFTLFEGGYRRLVCRTWKALSQGHHSA